MSDRRRRQSPHPGAFAALVVLAAIIAAGSVAGTLAVHKTLPAATLQR